MRKFRAESFFEDRWTSENSLNLQKAGRPTSRKEYIEHRPQMGSGLGVAELKPAYYRWTTMRSARGVTGLRAALSIISDRLLLDVVHQLP